MSLKEKQHLFLEKLNDKLPINIRAELRPSLVLQNVVNVLIVSGMNIIQIFGLSEDTNKESGEKIVYWFSNNTGQLY